MTKHFPTAVGSAALLLFLVLSAAVVAGQKPTFEQVIEVLKQGAGFTPEDFEALEKGEVVVKKLDVDEDGEVAFCGALKLTATRDVVFDAFRRAVERQQKEVADEFGVFRNPPDISDLTRLTIKDSEIRSLKNCKPGDCSWSLSNDLINRFTSEIDWNDPRSEDQAWTMFKQVMVDNLREYMKNGDAALMVYNDDPEPLNVADDMRLILGRILWLKDFAPEFNAYLNDFPNVKLDGIEDESTWSKIRVGFKQVIINTHTIFYKKSDEGVPQGLIISKQIYANHYFHSSLSLTGVISFPNAGGSLDTYVFFVSHTRAGALTGTMGKLASVAVDGEAETKLTDVLKDTKRYTGYGMAAANPEPSETPGILSRVFGNLWVWVLILLIVIVPAIWFATRGYKE